MDRKRMKEVGRRIFEKMQLQIIEQGEKDGKTQEEITLELKQLRRNLYDKPM